MQFPHFTIVGTSFMRFIAAVLCAASPLFSVVAADPPSAEVLANLTVEQLLNVTVTSVARRAEKVSHSPAAVHVITQEDIRRSGATSIPEVLRLVPGLNVARLNSHQWAISARGFNDVFANKLLVLIDGRSVYTPLFSGVFWDIQDTLLEDIDRIEVIRGPGAALWGANAVNGVINIITKTAAETQGFLMTGGGGNEERGFGAFRYGGKISDNAHYRVYGKYFNRDDSAAIPSGPDNDDWQTGQFGFRTDWKAAEADLFTLQGDIFKGREDELYRRLMPQPPFSTFEDRATDRMSGGNILGRWTHTFSPRSEFALQTYFDRTNRETAILGENRNTFDVDFQHRFGWGERQTIVWGGGYRLTSDTIQNTFDARLDPSARSSNLLSAFLQDEVTLVPKRLVLTVGSKFEHNDFTGFELQPSARLLWTPDQKQSFWGSISRAVRTPSRAEDDIHLRGEPVIPQGALFAGFAPFIPPSPTIVTATSGRRDFGSEKLIAYELGYRVQVTPRVSLDVASFYNDYDELRSLELASTVPDFTKSPAEFSVNAQNNLKGETYGGEVSLSYQPTDWWRLRADYAFLETALHLDGGGDIRTERNIEGSSPQNQFAVRSSIDLPHGFEFDAALRYVDSLPALQVPSYLELDLRLGWHISKNVEFSIVGHNLLDNRHPEFKPTIIATQPAEIERSIYGKITIRF